MTSSRLRAIGAIAIAVSLVGVGSTGALAQSYGGSTVTAGGDTSEVGAGDVTILQPGVIISGGDVSNETGIGVVIGGGSSIGASTGGDTNASVVE